MTDEETTNEVPLTAEAYSRWLRALRPQPLLWFLGLSELEQETLSALGDDYLVHAQDVILGDDIGDPMDNPDDEERMLRALAEQNPPSLVGINKRREARSTAEQHRKDAGRSFMGTPPDSVKERMEAGG
jgi:hypothetical protein